MTGICGDTFTMYGSTSTCQRPEQHKGEHQQIIADRLIGWDKSGRSASVVPATMFRCTQCGALDSCELWFPDRAAVMRSWAQCFRCSLESERAA